MPHNGQSSDRKELFVASQFLISDLLELHTGGQVAITPNKDSRSVQLPNDFSTSHLDRMNRQSAVNMLSGYLKVMGTRS